MASINPCAQRQGVSIAADQKVTAWPPFALGSCISIPWWGGLKSLLPVGVVLRLCTMPLSNPGLTQPLTRRLSQLQGSSFPNSPRHPDGQRWGRRHTVTISFAWYKAQEGAMWRVQMRALEPDICIPASSASYCVSCATYLTFLCLSFIIYKVEIIIVSTPGS